MIVYEILCFHHHFSLDESNQVETDELDYVIRAHDKKDLMRKIQLLTSEADIHRIKINDYDDVIVITYEADNVARCFAVLISRN